jgi:hypothetical protein
MRTTLIVLALLFAGCIDYASPPAVDEPEVEASIDGREITPGVHELQSSGFGTYFGKSLSGENGTYSIDHLDPFFEDSIQLWAVYAFEDINIDFEQRYHIYAEGPTEQAGEGNEVATNACPSIGPMNARATEYFVNRTLGKPANVEGGLFTSVSSSDKSFRIYLLDSGGTGQVIGETDVPTGDWFGFYGRLSQIHPANIKPADFMFTNLTITGEHALVSLPSAPWVCRETFNAANEGADFVQTPLVELQTGGTGSWFSPYGSFMVACGEKYPLQIWFPRDRNSATLDLAGEMATIGEKDIFFAQTLEAVYATVEVEEWWGYPRFTYGGVPYEFMVGGHDCEP